VHRPRIAKRYVAEGARVVIADIDEAPARRQSRARAAARFVRTDVARPATRANVIAEALGFAGDIDILVNNAGSFTRPTFSTSPRPTSTA